MTDKLYTWVNGHPTNPRSPPPLPLRFRVSFWLETRYWPMLIGLAYVLVFLCACGTSNQDVDKAPDQWERGIKLTPVRALADLTSWWADRWTAASGIEIAIVTDGTPVDFETAATDIKDGNDDCAQTIATFATRSHRYLRVDYVLIDPDQPHGCMGYSVAVGHEFFHVLAGPFGAHTEVEGLASTHATRDALIDEASLIRVCETAPCTAFEPESI